jgi:hypothetical protein
VGHSSELPIKPIIMVATDVLLEVVAGDNTVDIKQEPNRIVNGGDAVDQQLQMIPIKLAMDLVDVTINCCCKNSKVLKVFLQGLHGGNRVDGGKPHKDLVQKRCILHTVKNVCVAIGEQPCLSLSRKCTCQANGHHCVVLLGTTFGIRLTCLAKSLATNLQGCFIDLSVALDEIYRTSTAVGNGSDLLCALVPSHCNGAIVSKLSVITVIV